MSTSALIDYVWCIFHMTLVFNRKTTPAYLWHTIHPFIYPNIGSYIRCVLDFPHLYLHFKLFHFPGFHRCCCLPKHILVYNFGNAHVTYSNIHTHIHTYVDAHKLVHTHTYTYRGKKSLIYYIGLCENVEVAKDSKQWLEGGVAVSDVNVGKSSPRWKREEKREEGKNKCNRVSI